MPSAAVPPRARLRQFRHEQQRDAGDAERRRDERAQRQCRAEHDRAPIGFMNTIVEKSTATRPDVA